MKSFKTYDEQIDILKSRNLEIKDKSKAKDILSQINYYNLINGYKDPFLIKTDKFKDNTSLEEIYSLHEMDRELKQVVFSSLLRFEKLLKTSCAYNFSNLHKDGLYPYLQVENYSNSKHQLSYVLNNLATLSSTIRNQTRNSNAKKPIRHYINKHEDIPLWVLVNFLTFGNISHFYNSLDESLQNIIAKDFGQRYKENYNSKEKISKSELIEVIKICNFFRNVCAHDEVMYSFTLNKSCQTAIFEKFFDEEFTGKNLHDLILSLKLVLPKNEYQNLINSLSKIKIKYKDEFKSISINKIFEISGFKNQ
ncbi:Abi family protein [Anaerococcus hydrogenalis]|uniref:Abi family protein n=1 Tax=Anaerococcus hydrogenalis TaxID=33029 RepID=UPI00290228E0|nr:Abi family protein [Anaerococcus hydrogenalis]MDU1315806.1 Abi family protein [Anaerococcus hydrogenalis]